MKVNLRTISKLLNDFSNFVDNRQTIFWFSSEEMFLRILDWHFRMWREEQSYLSHNQNSSVTYQYFQIKSILNSIIQKIEETTLKQKEDFLFFRCFKKHIEMHKEDYIEVNAKKSYYAEDSLKTFYQILFETDIDFPTRLHLWKDWFPHRWKVTKNNLKKERLANISLNQFSAWAKERIGNPKEEYDKNLDTVAANLFPQVEPTVWSKILMFVFSSYGPSRVQSVIERPWNFGLAPRTRTYVSPPHKLNEMMQRDEETERQNTFELAYLLFKEHFTKQSIERYLGELKKLTYQEDSKEECKRLKLLDVFTDMLKFLNQ